MVSSRRFRASFLVCIAFLFLAVSSAHGQVTTATLYGVVQDTSRSVLPGVNVTVTHQGTTLTRETVTDARGEFALPALPAGPYAIKIELSGFKTYTSEGLRLGAGQEVRQSYVLEVGTLEDTITVTESTPLGPNTSTSATQTIGAEGARGRRGDRAAGVPAEPAERDPARLGRQFERPGSWRRPRVSRQRHRR